MNALLLLQYILCNLYFTYVFLETTYFISSIFSGILEFYVWY